MGEPTMKEIEELTKERDEALNSATNLRVKLGLLMKEKMTYETESIIKLKDLETN